MACIVLMPGFDRSSETAEAILRDVQKTLAVAKLPAWIAFVDTLPVTGTQRIQKSLIFPEGEDPRADPRTIDLRQSKRRYRRAETGGLKGAPRTN
jgi:crotonobetaine/carnitine-CoA ligase